MVKITEHEIKLPELDRELFISRHIALFKKEIGPVIIVDSEKEMPVEFRVTPGVFTDQEHMMMALAMALGFEPEKVLNFDWLTKNKQIREYIEKL